MDNFTLVNLTKECLPILLDPTPVDQLLNLLRITVIVLVSLWCILIIAIKEFRVRPMIFMHNLNVICLAHCILEISRIVYTSCTVLQGFQCFLQAYVKSFLSLLSGYGISALALYRLYLIKTVEKNKKLSYKQIFVSFAIFKNK